MNIIVDLNYPIKDGTEVVFRSPVDCSQVTGLLVNYYDNGPCSKEFAFADANGKNVGDIDHLFAENVVVKVILDKVDSDTTGMAFVQNADTNAYLEGRFAELEDKIVTANTANAASGIPDEINILVGSQFYIYFRNVLTRKDAHFWCNEVNGLETKLYNDSLVITATEAGHKTLSWKVYDNLLNVLNSGELTVIACEDKRIHCTALVIGDSTVSQCNGYSQVLLNNVSAMGGSLTLLGTRGTAPNLHEGRPGWATSTYCNSAETSSYTNPFYNNGFDFSYYMEQQGYSGVDVVVIQLGINDIFGMTLENFTPNTVLSNLQTMVDSILAYDNDIKVIVNLITPPNGNNYVFTEEYGTQQVEFAYRTNTIRMSQAIIGHFACNDFVTICANNCIIDDEAEIADGVHPTQGGYATLGQNVYETIVNISELDLLGLHKRTAVFREGKTTQPTTAKEMAFDKMYYFDARSGYSMGSGTNGISLNDLVVTKNAIKFTAVGSLSAYGMSVPLDLVDGKTYKAEVAKDTTTMVYVVTYTKDGDMWTFEGFKQLNYERNAGSLDFYSHTFTAEAGKGYTLLFALTSNSNGVLSEFTNISLVEVE